MARGRYEKKPEPRPRGKWGRKILIGILVVLLIIGAAGAVAVNYVLGKLGRFDPPNPEQLQDTTPITDEFDTNPTIEGQETIQTVDPSDVTFQDVDVLEGEDVIHIMLIGQDARPGEGRSRSDTMILVTLNRAKNAIQLTSFMRDTYVQIPGYVDNRLNVAYRYGGTELMNETFLVNFGLEIDGNVMVDFKEFANIINLLGGVDMELNQEEADYMHIAGHPDVVTGLNHLNGEEALTFVRMRYVSGGDYGRTERQRRVLTALAASFRDASIGTILDLMDEVLPHVVTNLSHGQIIDYATAGLSMMADGAKIQSLRIPADDAHYGAMIRGMSVMIPDLLMCREDLQEFFYGTDD